MNKMERRNMVGGKEDYGYFVHSKAPTAQALTFMIRNLQSRLTVLMA